MDVTRICSVEGCGKGVYVKPYCGPHYYRSRKYGDPLAGRQHRGSSIALLKSTVGHVGEECLLWPYGMDAAGYGALGHDQWTGTASNVMCELAHGPAPEDRPHAAHRCGNRPCFNPNHLRWATPTENANDKREHGTLMKGTAVPNSVLDEDKVRAIRRLIGAGESQQRIADRFGISRTNVSAIATRRSWAWLK